MEEPCRVLSTGGTIDESKLDPITGKSLFTRSYIPKMVEETEEPGPITVENIFQKDSVDITEGDRQAILKKCVASLENRIIVTHGTNMMIETARLLGENISNKTIVLVGAFVPYLREDSDAVPNLKFAIANARQLPPGVYVAMNGKVFPWDNVRKNKEKQVFEELG